MIPRRRLLIASALAALSAALSAHAQERRVRRIGFFYLATVQQGTALLSAFREGMSALGWVDGRDYVIDARFGEGIVQGWPGLAGELVATRPDLLLTSADEAARLLAQRTSSIPIVFAIAQDPLASQLVASLRSPGGNVTGLTRLASELGVKRLQLLKEAFPSISHIGLLTAPADMGTLSEAKAIEDSAERMGIRVTPIALHHAADVEPAFKRGAALGVRAYILTSGPVTGVTLVRPIVGHLRRSRIPAMYPVLQAVEAGGLMSYTTSTRDAFRRAATYVDKIFKGAKPGELPVEQPTKFELVVNLKTAKAMGISIPLSFLARADRVIE